MESGEAMDATRARLHYPHQLGPYASGGNCVHRNAYELLATLYIELRGAVRSSSLCVLRASEVRF